MELLPSNYQDIRKYYCDSYVKLKEFGDQLFYITKVNMDSVYFRDENNNEGIIYLHEEEPYTLRPSMPNKTMFQLGAHAYSMVRFPARQYSRGITSQNCKIYRLSAYGWDPIDLGFTTLKGYTDKPGFSSALDIVSSSQVSLAISERFAINRCGNIYCDLLVIGRWNIDKIFTIDPLFILEFTRLAKLANIYDKISIVEQKEG